MNRSVKLSPRTVRNIRRLQTESHWTLRSLARRYGVGVSTIRDVVVGQTWKS